MKIQRRRKKGTTKNVLASMIWRCRPYKLQTFKKYTVQIRASFMFQIETLDLNTDKMILILACEPFIVFLTADCKKSAKSVPI